MAGRHDAALLHRVVQQGQRRRGAVGTADGKAHLLQNAGHAVAYRRGGRQRQIHDAEWRIQPPGRLRRHHLTHAGDLERRFLDGLRHHVKGLPLAGLQSVVHHARAGHAHVDDAVRLAHAVERTGHEGVVLHSVAEHHQLGAAEAAPVRGALRQLLDGAAHEGHRIHVDARLGGAHVDGRAHQVGGGKSFWDGGNELPVCVGHALLDQGGETADEVDTGSFGRPVQGGGKGGVVVCLRRSGHQGDGGDGDALVDDGDAEFLLDGLAGGHQIFGAAGDLVVDGVTGLPGVAAGAGQQGDAHGDGAHVQMLLVDHLDGLHDLVLIEHSFLL